MKSFEDRLNNKLESLFEDNDVVEMSSDSYANNLKSASEEPSRGTLKGGPAGKYGRGGSDKDAGGILSKADSGKKGDPLHGVDSKNTEQSHAQESKEKKGDVVNEEVSKPYDSSFLKNQLDELL